MIVDSSVWIAWLRGLANSATQRLERSLRQGRSLWMPDVVYQEVLQGAASPADFIRLQDRLDLVPAFEPEDAREIARQAAMLYARCRWRGVTPRSPNDCLIAACALEAGEPLLHLDADFERMAQVEPRLQLLS